MTNIVIYLTATCPYCLRAKILLDKKNVTYVEHYVEKDNTLMDEMVERSQRYSVPQIFIDDRHIGGFDDMYMMDLDDELDPLLFPESDS